MSALEKIAFYQNQRDEVPNQELAKELAASRDIAGIHEIAQNLWSKEARVQSDCLKVLYELGYLAPELVADYYPEFLKLLKSRNNRMVWGAMIALATIAPLKADELFEHLGQIQVAIQSGSVITVDNGVKTLALIAAHKQEYRRVIFPLLMSHLSSCRAKDVAQHSEKSLPAVDEYNRLEFISVLEKRMPDLSGSEITRVKKVIHNANRMAQA